MDMKNRSKKITILIFLIAFAIFINTDRWTLSDRYAVWRNPPPPEVAGLADKTGMSNLGRRIFFASVPSIDGAEEFNANCSDIETTMIILGCYSRGRIHIFNVRDSRIADAKYVTSAHEMLHAAYMRLSKTGRDRVNGLLEDAYQRTGENDELRDVMAEYARVEPEQRHNELHSILGTEYAELPPELEEYYAGYFADRNKIVGMAFKYRKVFKNLEAEQSRLKAHLDRLAETITTDLSLLDTMIAWINEDIEAFNVKNFHSRSEFNAERAALIEKENEINELRTQIEVNIRQHDKMAEEYNNLGGKIAQLNYQLDSKSQTGDRPRQVKPVRSDH